MTRNDLFGPRWWEHHQNEFRANISEGLLGQALQSPLESRRIFRAYRDWPVRAGESAAPHQNRAWEIVRNLQSVRLHPYARRDQDDVLVAAEAAQVTLNFSRGPRCPCNCRASAPLIRSVEGRSGSS
jgi:hypothetical protein